MTETYTPKSSRVAEKSRTPKVLGAALIATLATVIGVKTVEQNTPPQRPAVNGPYREYVVKPFDTESSILQRAYPTRDWRSVTSVIENQIPEKDRAEHIVRAGEVLTFGTDAEIGKVVSNPAEVNSAPAG